MITIDGSQGAGGGQIVRTALALSALTGTPVELRNIRPGRKKPGLKAQHVHAARALQKLCGAELEGAEEGSDHVRFHPGPIEAKRVKVDVGSAGSLTLVMQALLLPLCFAKRKVEVTLRGGTDTLWSPPIDFFLRAVLPHFEVFAKIDCKVIRRGFYPRGAGEIELEVTPKIPLDALRAEIPAYDLCERGKLREVCGFSFASQDLERRSVAERQATGARHALSQLGVPVRIKKEYSQSLSTGSGIVLWADYDAPLGGNKARLAADVLGEQHKRAETVGEEAAQVLRDQMDGGAAVDRHTADQIVPLLALRGGKIMVSEVTPHTGTNAAVVNQILGGRVHISGNTLSAGAWTVECAQ